MSAQITEFVPEEPDPITRLRFGAQGKLCIALALMTPDYPRKPDFDEAEALVEKALADLRAFNEARRAKR